MDYDDYGSSAVSATSATGTTAPSDVGSADLVSRYGSFIRNIFGSNHVDLLSPSSY